MVAVLVEVVGVTVVDVVVEAAGMMPAITTSPEEKTMMPKYSLSFKPPDLKGKNKSG